MVKAVEAQGTKIEISQVVSPLAYSEVPNVTDFNGPGGQASVIDVSNLQSTAREKKMGLADEGQFTFTLNWDPDDAAHQLLRSQRASRLASEFRVTLADTTPSIATFTGYVLGVVISGGVDNVLKAAVTVEIDGSVSWA